MKEHLQTLLAVVAVSCALVVTLLVIRREFGQPASPAVGEQLRVSLDSLVANAPHSSGPRDAEQVIVEFFDFQCPACRMLSFALDTVRSRWPHPLRLVRRHYPLIEIHPRAQELALTALCLPDDSTFDAFYHRTFAEQGRIGGAGYDGPVQFLPEWADSAAIRTCVDAPDTWTRLAEGLRLGQRLGLRATPSIVIGGRLFTGVRSADEIIGLLEKELE